MTDPPSPAALILADSRFPGGGHVHSGGLEQAVSQGLVSGLDDLAGFLAGRLRTAGRLAAVFATPAQRAASRAQGRGTARAALVAWPSPVLADLLAVTPRPHHAVLVGAVHGSTGGNAGQAALTTAYLAVSGPASAAVRLLGLDPFAVNAVLARLGPALTELAAEAARTAADRPADLPAPSSPALDLLAEAHDRHHQQEVRLFAS